MKGKITAVLALILCAALCAPAAAASSDEWELPQIVIDPLATIGDDDNTGEAAEDPEGNKWVFSHPEDLVLDDSIVIADGIYADGINLGGLNPAAAQEAIDDYYSAIGESEFTIAAGKETFHTTLNELGFTYNSDGIVKEAAFLGQYGSLVDRYKTLMDMKYNGVVMNVDYSIDEQAVRDYVNANLVPMNAEKVEATIKRENGEFVVSPSVTGIAVDVEGSVRAIMKTLEEQDLALGMSAEASVTVDEPARSSAVLSQVRDILGSFTTDYEDSKPGRKTNIQVASDRVNGTLLMPGESFSTSDTIKERTKENGYELAAEYINGGTAEAYGGGVCQVATTLYNAVLRAELQVDERHNHSMLVSYVEPSFDAAISWGVYDFRFTNNLTYPIYIATSCDGSTMTYTIYGKEDRPSNRKVEFTNEIVSYIEAETIENEDPALPVGTVLKSGKNRAECTSYLVKKVYINNELTDTVKFAKDHYNMTHRVVTTGTMPVVEPSTTAGEPAEPAAPQEPADGGQDGGTADEPAGTGE